MTLENARVLYKHRKNLGKDVSDIVKRFPELEKEIKEIPKEAPEILKVKDKDGTKPKR